MFISSVLLFCVIFAFCETREASIGEKAGLAKVVNIHKVNLLDDFQEQENRIFENLPSECFKVKTLKKSSSKFEYYASTKALYKSLATQSGLEGSLQSKYTFGVTVSVATKRKSSEKTEVSGMSLIKQASTDKIYVDKECLVSTHKSTFTEEFIEDLEQLPLKIEKPWLRNSWTPYKIFQKKYGSHLITSRKRGSKFQLMVFAESSKSYSERDFQVKACVSAAGPTSAGQLSVSACSNVSKSEISKASKMSMSVKRFVTGGKRSTNTQLANGKKSPELIDQLMNEADDSSAPVQHTFMSLPGMLQSRFKPGSDNYVRATNLEYYFKGYLNYDCPYERNGDVVFQKFDYSSQSRTGYPDFECSLAKEGCHGYNDCHNVGFWCTCKGKTCVRHKSNNEDPNTLKTIATVNKEDWDWKGCDWKIWSVECDCYNSPLNERKVVWALTSRVKDEAKHHAPRNGTHNEGYQLERKAERLLPNTGQDAATAEDDAKQRGPTDGTYQEPEDSVRGQPEGREEDAGKHRVPYSTPYEAKDPIQNQVKEKFVWALPSTAQNAAEHQALNKGAYSIQDPRRIQHPNRIHDPVQDQPKQEEIGE